MILNYDLCAISSVGDVGIFAIVADRRCGLQGDTSIFDLMSATLEILSSTFYGTIDLNVDMFYLLYHSFVHLFDFLIYFRYSLN